jgi:protein phosphatase
VTPRLRSAARSDLGKLRFENQDRCLFRPEVGLFGVADGVGGMPGGADAAEAAAESVTAAVLALPPGERPDLRTIVRQANEAVIAVGRRVSPVYGVATTLTFGCVRQGQLLVAHVGDSRCYLREGKRLIRLTEDHTVENDARRRGEPPPGSRLERGAITRCIGQQPMPGPDLIELPLHPGERYLFCTDGITRVMTDAELAAQLDRPGEPADILESLIALTLRRGGPDNASGVLIYVDEA